MKKIQRQEQVDEIIFRKIKSFGYEVIVTSHTQATKEFQEEVDYFVYDKDNIVLSDVEYLGWMTWYAPNYDITSKEFLGSCCWFENVNTHTFNYSRIHQSY